jgi:hypothetical protein
MSRDASDGANKADSVSALWAFALGTVPLVLQGDLHGIYREEPGDYEFASAKLSAEASCALKPFLFSVKPGYAVNKAGEGKAEAGASASIRGRWGRLSLKASADSEGDWEAGVSWRLQL